MYYIKSLPPIKGPAVTWTHTRFGIVIPKEETEVKNLKDFFIGSPLSEEKLFQELKKDIRIFIETDKEKESRLKQEKIENEVTPEYQLEQKTKKYHKTEKLQREIDEFNEEKEKAMATPDKEDDKVIAEKEKKLNKKIEEGGI